MRSANVKLTFPVLSEIIVLPDSNLKTGKVRTTQIRGTLLHTIRSTPSQLSSARECLYFPTGTSKLFQNFFLIATSISSQIQSKYDKYICFSFYSRHKDKANHIVKHRPFQFFKKKKHQSLEEQKLTDPTPLRNDLSLKTAQTLGIDAPLEVNSNECLCSNLIINDNLLTSKAQILCIYIQMRRNNNYNKLKIK